MDEQLHERREDRTAAAHAGGTQSEGEGEPDLLREAALPSWVCQRRRLRRSSSVAPWAPWPAICWRPTIQALPVPSLG